MDITQRRMTKIAREGGSVEPQVYMDALQLEPAEFDLIHVVRHAPGITQAEACKRLGVDKGAVARQAANLESKGYLIRARNPKDGRSQLLYATEKAERLKNSKTQVETLFYEWLLEPLGKKERREFVRVLELLYQRSKAESRAGFPNVAERIKGEDRNEE